MSENNSNNNIPAENSASQPAPEIFSDATGRFLNNNNAPESPQKVYSASQPDASTAASILKKGRKSLTGRRVSFAATAHVRVFGNEEKAAAEEAARRRKEAEEAEEQRQLEEFRKQFTNDPIDNNVEGLKESFNEFDIKSSPLVSNVSTVTTASTPNVSTPSKRPFTSIDQSFDGNPQDIICSDYLLFL